ncbi:Uncharacterized protein PECH_008038 [Penicillium ucsense]|uniref:Uncharacterized protein n=1 Tax=Penicillium ucsense TaxID=2839758 RepID=A0A8J8WG50_9EURO|nr:Uncharacterized protein PECM_007784 [Penicillium ucsense]KAF7734448.1 Uncharacterized protein PECH_008038 [Penicillium ucsense]
MAPGQPMFTPDSEFADLERPRGRNGSCLSISALARFEFEAGKGNEGTKILMIEWEDDDLSRSTADGSWHVSWTGKTTVLPADERPSDSLRRFYFLLPPHVTIPPVVTLTYEPRSSDPGESQRESTASLSPRHTLQLNPLPAIFPPGLGATGRSAGKKGVLHTIWAKKRLRVLDQEIHDECLTNAEGVALHMAVKEKEWIETNFGVTVRNADGHPGSFDSSTSNSVYPTGPATPVSPVSGRKLTDKLRGLKLQTGEKDLAVKESSDTDSAHLLSPQSPDVAVSSFSSFSNTMTRPVDSIPTPVTNPTPTPNTSTDPAGLGLPKAVALFPPESIQAAQQNQPTAFFTTLGSLTTGIHNPNVESGDELFAKALSPRSPDLPRSPFSF